MLGLRLRVHDVLPGLAALKPRRIRRMTTDEGRELLCNIQGPIAARLIAISQARFATGGSTNIISIFRRSSRPICRSSDSLQDIEARKHPAPQRDSAWVCHIFSGRPRTGRWYRVARNGGLHDARPIIPGSGQRWKTAFKTPMIASGGTANELHG